MANPRPLAMGWIQPISGDTRAFSMRLPIHRFIAVRVTSFGGVRP